MSFEQFMPVAARNLGGEWLTVRKDYINIGAAAVRKCGALDKLYAAVLFDREANEIALKFGDEKMPGYFCLTGAGRDRGDSRQIGNKRLWEWIGKKCVAVFRCEQGNGLFVFTIKSEIEDGRRISKKKVERKSEIEARLADLEKQKMQLIETAAAL